MTFEDRHQLARDASFFRPLDPLEQLQQAAAAAEAERQVRPDVPSPSRFSRREGGEFGRVTSDGIEIARATDTPRPDVQPVYPYPSRR